MKAITNILLGALIVFVLAYVLPGVSVEGYLTAIIVAVVLGVLNYIVKPLLVLLTLPITVFTLGIFLLVINAFIIILAGKIVPGFYVDGFLWALLFSVILSIANSWINYQKFTNRPYQS